MSSSSLESAMKKKKGEKKKNMARPVAFDQIRVTHRMDECSRVVDSSKRGLCRASESRTMNKRTRLLQDFTMSYVYFFFFPPTSRLIIAPNLYEVALRQFIRRGSLSSKVEYGFF